jgi:hypothetical protein
MPMKKHLNVDQIQSELRGGSAFFPGYKSGDSPTPPSEETEKTSVADFTRNESASVTTNDKPQEAPQAIAERENARTPVRPNGKRIITRNSFEIYEDQMDSLRKLSLQDKMEGKLGSMSQMVREAIDTYLKQKASRG